MNNVDDYFRWSNMLTIDTEFKNNTITMGIVVIVKL
ncbi:MAG: hypothetical protein JWO58_1498 [Chitinophagaceae bacterium]|nr:hypothetical protein [Chitinophagaceae bacterium]